MIEPGLSRISRLVNPSTFPWKAIHVAGTNGKGSVCAYLSAMLTADGARCGRFTSPHLIDRWDCITIRDKIVDPSLFTSIAKGISDLDHEKQVKASEFEQLTATAFEIFNHEEVDVGVIEVGMGGRLDATNILEKKLVTVITKIGHDHEAYLGRTVREIALHKAGVMRPGVQCVIDGTNSPEVLSILQEYAHEVGAEPVVVLPDHSQQNSTTSDNYIIMNNLEPHQKENLACAEKALELSLKQLCLDTDISTLIKAALTSCWPGRLEKVDLSTLMARTEPVLLDGAHNAQSAEALRLYVDRHLRTADQPVTWILAASKGKGEALRDLFGTLIQDGDKVVLTTFGPVEGMPWVAPTHVDDIEDVLSAKEMMKYEPLEEALATAAQVAAGGPLVIAGSLYLISDVHRLLRISRNKSR